MPAMTPKLTIRSIEFLERPVRFRMPFRFGAAEVHGAPQIFVHVGIDIDGLGKAAGATAELMVPKWFNKDPALSPDHTVEQLRRALALARELYLQHGRYETAFGLHAACHDRLIAACGREGIPPLAAAFGIAELDKAVLDALLRATGLDVFAGLMRNVAGLDARLTPDLDDETISEFLTTRNPLARVFIRHTIGMADPLDALADIHRSTGCRYFKIKLGGDPAVDRGRLMAIADKLTALNIDHRVTLDANEQYRDRTALTTLVDALRNDGALAPIARRLLYIEQPLPREATFDAPLGDLGERVAFIVDEAESAYDTFPKAVGLGYRGISSKACKGIYKSLLNGARARHWSAAGATEAFIAAEDLTCQPGLALQQDTALAAFHGIAHTERNGHHYVDGFAATPASEANAFLRAHPDLYVETDGKIHLAIHDGAIVIGSLVQPGFACSVDPDRIGRPSTENHHLQKELSA